MFLCLAIASHILRSSVKKEHSEMFEKLENDMKHKKGAEVLGPMGSYLYVTINHHFWFEIAGFLVAAFAAVVEFLLTYGWH